MARRFWTFITDMAALTLIASGLGFPEGPVVMSDGSILVAEIRAGRITRIRPSGDRQTVAEVGGGPNGLAIGPHDMLYVCNNGGFAWHEQGGLVIPTGAAENYNGGSIQRVDLTTGAIETVVDHFDGRLLSGPNDLVFDSSGGFYFTDTGKSFDHHSDHGALYYYDGKTLSRVAAPLDQPNGVVLSPDGQRLYVSETRTARLWWWDIKAPGELVEGKTLLGAGGGNFLYAESRYRLFDSMAMEANGAICVSTLLEGGVSVVDANGALIDRVDVAEEIAITNIAFGGLDMRDAYLTASTTGCIYKMRWPRSGHPLHYPMDNGSEMAKEGRGRY